MWNKENNRNSKNRGICNRLPPLAFSKIYLMVEANIITLSNVILNVLDEVFK